MNTTLATIWYKDIYHLTITSIPNQTFFFFLGFKNRFRNHHFCSAAVILSSANLPSNDDYFLTLRENAFLLLFRGWLYRKSHLKRSLLAPILLHWTLMMSRVPTHGSVFDDSQNGCDRLLCSCSGFSVVDSLSASVKLITGDPGGLSFQLYALCLLFLGWSTGSLVWNLFRTSEDCLTAHVHVPTLKHLWWRS